MSTVADPWKFLFALQVAVIHMEELKLAQFLYHVKPSFLIRGYKKTLQTIMCFVAISYAGFGTGTEFKLLLKL